MTIEVRQLLIRSMRDPQEGSGAGDGVPNPGAEGALAFRGWKSLMSDLQ